jgi:hypothetical protein
MFLSFWYILFLPFAPCIGCAKTVCELLLKIINYCETIGGNIKDMKPLCG